MGLHGVCGVRWVSGRLIPLLCAVLLGGAAQASPADEQEALVREPAKACWVELDTGLSLCADDGENLADAVLAQHGIALKSEDPTLAPSASALESFERQGIGPRAATVIGIIYQDDQYRGSSLVVTTSRNNCTGYSFGYPNLGTVGWNDRLTSFRSFSNCKTIIYEDVNYKGATLSGVDVPNVGRALNDRTSSIRWVAR